MNKLQIITFFIPFLPPVSVEVHVFCSKFYQTSAVHKFMSKAQGRHLARSHHAVELLKILGLFVEQRLEIWMLKQILDHWLAEHFILICCAMAEYFLWMQPSSATMSKKWSWALVTYLIVLSETHARFAITVVGFLDHMERTSKSVWTLGCPVHP